MARVLCALDPTSSSPSEAVSLLPSSLLLHLTMCPYTLVAVLTPRGSARRGPSLRQDPLSCPRGHSHRHNLRAHPSSSLPHLRRSPAGHEMGPRRRCEGPYPARRQSWRCMGMREQRDGTTWIGGLSRGGKVHESHRTVDEGEGREYRLGESSPLLRHKNVLLTRQVSAGHTFSLFLTNTGQVYAAGSSESGQLGNGKTGKSKFTPSSIQTRVKALQPC